MCLKNKLLRAGNANGRTRKYLCGSHTHAFASYFLCFTHFHTVYALTKINGGEILKNFFFNIKFVPRIKFLVYIFTLYTQKIFQVFVLKVKRVKDLSPVLAGSS